MDENNNGHTHALPLVKIEITYDPNHNSINYKFDGIDYFRAFGLLAWVQQLIFADFQEANKKYAEVTDAD